MRRLLSFFAFFWLFSLHLQAEESDLRLSIAMEGESLSYYGRHKPSQTTEDIAKWPYFNVVLYSEAELPLTIKGLESDWHRALSFTLTLENGRQFDISRPPRSWARNPGETWRIGRGRCRVFVVNFATGDWQGLPANSDLRSGESMKLKAAFQFPTSAGELRATSPPVTMHYR